KYVMSHFRWNKF
nr:MSH gamma [Pelophylax ridibundus]